VRGRGILRSLDAGAADVLGDRYAPTSTRRPSKQHLYSDNDVEGPKDHHRARHRDVDERFSSGAQSVVVLAHPVALR
jgi:hypothetical protein